VQRHSSRDGLAGKLVTSSTAGPEETQAEDQHRTRKPARTSHDHHLCPNLHAGSQEYRDISSSNDPSCNARSFAISLDRQTPFDLGQWQWEGPGARLCAKGCRTPGPFRSPSKVAKPGPRDRDVARNQDKSARGATIRIGPPTVVLRIRRGY